MQILSLVTSFALLLTSATGAGAQNGILEGVRVSKDDGIGVVTVDLSEPVRYLSQALSPAGTTLQIRVSRLATTVEELADGGGRDRVVPTGPGADLVTEITYQSAGGRDGTLIVRFARAVRPTVRALGDRESIAISVPLGSGATPEARRPTPLPTPPAPAPGVGTRVEPQPTPAGGTPVASPAAAAATGEVAEVMEQGGRAMVAKDYTLAVGFFTKVLQANDPAFEQEAQELLGVAQERNNHLAHAKAEYEEYLRLYPTGEGAERVRQRLGALLGNAREEKEPAAGGGGTPRTSFDKYLAGSFSQFFRRDSSVFDEEGELVDQSYLASDLDLTGRVRSDNYDVRTQLSGGYRFDIEGSSSSSNLRMRYLYIDATDRRHGLNTRIGRQSRSTGGVLGRFDGALLDYRLTERTRVNAVAGFPVELSNSNELNSERYFYGMSVDFGPFAEYWDVSGFAIQQQAEGFLDRRAVGGEIRYFRPEASFFTLVDYDISYLDLNILLVQGTYRFDNSATLGLIFDYRDTPALTTNNALIGQTVDSLDELQDLYDDGAIRDLASDRTQRSRAVTLSGSHPLTEKLQVAADLTVAKLSSTPSSGGIEGTPATREEFTVSSQLIGSDILWSGDVQIVGLRYANTDIADTGTFMLNGRVPVGGAWRLNPRLQIDLQSRTGGSEITVVKPALLVDYRWRRSLSFELEAGYERAEEFSGSTGNSRHGYYLYAGYRWDF